MKSFLSLALFMLAVALTATAQTTQSGYVKTKGRMDSNGKLIPGTRLGGAAITLTGGHSTVSGTDGSFKITVPDKKYYLQNVQKQGYSLTDPDMLKKQYYFSANPLVITMETPDRQLEDQLDAASRIRATLNAQLQKKEQEIKKLREQNQITLEEYQKTRKELLAAQESNERLINEMVEKYAQIDYDLLNDFNRQVSEYILNGELTKADSLLRTKGDLTDRIEEVRRHQSLNQKERKELESRQDNLLKSESYAQREIEDIAQDCYHFYTKCRLLQQNDSADYYMEMRAMLDTTNFDYVWECGSHFLHDKKYEKARYYLEMLVRNKNLEPVDMGMALNDLSVCYSYMGLGELGREAIRKSLELREGLEKSEPEKYAVSVALAASNYAAQTAFWGGSKDTSMKYFRIGMEHYEKLLTYSPFFAVNLANVEENYGLMLYQEDKMDEAEKYLVKAYNTRYEYATRYPECYYTTKTLSLPEISKLIGEVDCSSFIATRECKMIIISAAELNMEQLAHSAKQLHDLYLVKKDLDKSLQYMDVCAKVTDELYNTNREKYLSTKVSYTMTHAYLHLNRNEIQKADEIAGNLYGMLKELMSPTDGAVDAITVKSEDFVMVCYLYGIVLANEQKYAEVLEVLTDAQSHFDDLPDDDESIKHVKESILYAIEQLKQ